MLETNVLYFFEEFCRLRRINQAFITSDKRKFTIDMVKSLMPDKWISGDAVSAIISMTKDAQPLLKSRLHGTLVWVNSAERTRGGTEVGSFNDSIADELDTKRITDDEMLMPIYVGNDGWRGYWFIARITSHAARNFEIHLYDYTGEQGSLCFKIFRTLMAELEQRIPGATVRPHMCYQQIKISLKTSHDRAIDMLTTMAHMATKDWDSARGVNIDSKHWRASYLLKLWKLYVEELLKLAEGR
jgi:hypothetical protein